jgi:predicted nucleic acid-binding protein
LVATQLLTDFVATGRNEAVVSSASVAELMVRPIRAGANAESEARTFLLEYPGLSIRSVDVLVAGEAAAIRAETNLRLTDCLVAATAVLSGCGLVVTNDRLLAQRFLGLRPGIEVLLLADLAL